MPTRITETARVPEDISGRQRRVPVGGIHVAAYISCAAASQLSAVLLGPARLAPRHVDTADCDELVRLLTHKLKISARCSGGGRICANDAFIHLGRRDG